MIPAYTVRSAIALRGKLECPRMLRMGRRLGMLRNGCGKRRMRLLVRPAYVRPHRRAVPKVQRLFVHEWYRRGGDFSIIVSDICTDFIWHENLAPRCDHDAVWPGKLESGLHASCPLRRPQKRKEVRNGERQLVLTTAPHPGGAGGKCTRKPLESGQRGGGAIVDVVDAGRTAAHLREPLITYLRVH